MSATQQQRIEQFEKMASADPDNDMAHFSLGNAYLQAERFADAAASFDRCVAINPGMSKAWQLAGQALLAAGESDRALLMLNKGYEVAAGKGDRLPQGAIADLLRSIGHEPPKIVSATKASSAASDFVCRRTGRPGTRLASPPFRGPVGKWIYENISAETWQDWIGQGTKVINELRLDFSRDRDQEVYDENMREYLGIDDELLKQIRAG